MNHVLDYNLQSHKARLEGAIALGQKKLEVLRTQRVDRSNFSGNAVEDNEVTRAHDVLHYPLRTACMLLVDELKRVDALLTSLALVDSTTVGTE